MRNFSKYIQETFEHLQNKLKITQSNLYEFLEVPEIAWKSFVEMPT